MTLSKLILPSSFGAAQGTSTQADAVTQTIDGADLNAMWAEFQATVGLHNDSMDTLLAALTYPVTSPVESVMYPTGDEFEEASEFGVPKGIRQGKPFNLGFGFKWYDIAIRYTWQFLADSTQNQVEALNNSALSADTRLQFYQVMRAIFRDTSVASEVNGQPITVYPFYNGDGAIPPKWKNTTHDGDHTHYLTSGATALDSGDIDDIETHLRHHGYTPQLGYNFVLMVNRQEAQIIRGFRVADGDSFDFIPSGAEGGVIVDGEVIGAPQGTLPGQVGTYGPWRVVEEDYIPATYVFGFVTGGARNIGNPVGIREHANASMRGLRLVKGPDSDYPLTDSFYQHGLGTGIRHRGAGVVLQTTDGSYAVPSTYA